MTSVSLRFDLRFPQFAEGTHGDRYRECIRQAEWGDKLGLTSVTLAEHHGIDDGYMSSPLTIAAAVAARTERIGINIVAALVPLHDPVRFAEQAAAVQLLSNGRLLFVAGLGYRDEEFEMAGIQRKGRGAVMEEYVQVMLKAWTGEPFEWRGRTIRVTPRPESPPLVFIGGSTPRSARRAARLGLGYFPSIDDYNLRDIYLEECDKRNIQPQLVIIPKGPGFVHVTKDPERDWQRIMPYAMHEATTYASWQTTNQRSTVTVYAKTPEELRANGSYQVVTPEQCIEIARRDEVITLHPLMGGMPPELGWEGLRLFADEVFPHIQ